MFADFQNQHRKSKIEATPEPSSLVSVSRAAIFKENSGAQPSERNSKKMNCREQIREHLLAEKMKFWLMIARTPSIKPNIPKWRARRNYWFLCRKYPDLSRRIGCDETSVFRR
jgi:predicted transposase YbfD/YdcC